MATPTKLSALEEYKTAAEQELERKRKAKKEAADINYQKLMSYLPQQKSGVAKGVSESARLQAQNSYIKSVAEADNEHTAAYNELLNNYRVEKKAEQDELYNTIVGMMDSGEYQSVEDLKTFLDANKDGVSDVQRQLLEAKYDAIEQEAEDEEKGFQSDKFKTKQGLTVSGQLNNAFDGNNFKINGYKVELGGKAGFDDDFKKRFGDKNTGFAERQLFVYDGQLYINLNGVVYRVNGRSGKETDDYKNALTLFD